MRYIYLLILILICNFSHALTLNISSFPTSEDELFDKKIFKKAKGKLKLLNVGELEKPINLQVSYASKKAIEVLEKFGGKIKLTKK